MNINEELKSVWEKDYINQLPGFVKDRGFVYSVNDSAKDILITGINPSYRDGEEPTSFDFDFQKLLYREKWDNYWGQVKKLLYDNENNIDNRSKCAYLDIFYFREKNQKQLRNGILKCAEGVQFLVDQLKISQRVIEQIIRPKVILVKNMESAVYWGKYCDNGIIWMGYQLEKINTLNCGELFKISGLKESSERISPEITETNLMGSLILFTGHINQYTKREKRPTAKLIDDLLKMY